MTRPLRVSVLWPVFVATLFAGAPAWGDGSRMGSPRPEATASSGTVRPQSSTPSRNSDGDGMPDRWERDHRLDPHRADGGRDPDHDGLANGLEYWFKGNPHDPDTDGDGLRDGREVTVWHTAVNVRDQIVGRILGSGVCPDESSGPCSLRPLFAVTVVLRDPNSREVARTTTHGNGRFAFRAGPGTYTVEAERIDGFTLPGPAAAAVRSRRREPARVGFEYGASTGPGVVGQATRSPTCPVERTGDECVAPLGNARVHVEDASGSTVATSITGEDGYYAFSLGPGTYRLVGEPFDGGFPIAPGPVDFVVAAQDTGPSWIPLDYDTGIR